MIDHLIPHDFNGAAAIFHKETPLFQKAYGFRDLPNGVPNETATKFPTASAGKAFVATGIMQLIETGRLSMESPISGLLPFDLKGIDPSITVDELLSHTSGIPDYCDETVITDYADLFRDYPNYKIRASMDLLPFFVDKPMMYPRGQRFQYNNTGYVILGLIIENVTKQPFDRYLAQNVFKPLAMDNTGYYELDRLPGGCASAYIYDENTGRYYSNIYSVDVKGTGAGGAFTTMGDIHRFWLGLIRGDVLSADTFAGMTSPQAAESNYGRGFWLKKQAQGPLIPYFEGSDPGVSFISSWNPGTDHTICLVSNMAQDVWALHKAIENFLNT